MSVDRAFLSSLERYLDDEAGDYTPTYIERVLERTSDTRQRPWWSSPERWLSMDSTLRRSAVPSLPVRRLLLVAVVVLLLAAVAIVAGSRRTQVPPPFGVAANGSIASWSAGDLFLSDANGRNTRPLVSGPTVDEAPWYSHDGTRFVFRRVEPGGAHLWVAHADGSQLTALTAAPLASIEWYAWSPDDDRIAILYDEGGVLLLGILQATGSGVPSAVDLHGLYPDNVYWTPDEELVLRARPDPASDANAGIYAVRPDGTGWRQIRPTDPGDTGYMDMDVSPDGRHLAYWVPVTSTTTGQGRGQVHIVDVISGADRAMAFDATNPEANEFQFQFAPDGASGVLTRLRALAELVVAPIDGTPGRTIGRPFDLGAQPDRVIRISPDGRQVAIAFKGQAPMFVDVATGAVTTGPDQLGSFSSWQRLAP